MSKRLILILSLLAALALFVAACGGGQAPSAEEVQEKVEEVKEQVEEEAEEAMEEAEEAMEEVMAECTDPLGCVTVAPGDALKIASALVTSGPNESLGLDTQFGVEIAITQRGLVAGHEVELVAEDAQCSAEGGQTVATKIASDDTILGVVGHNCSSSCTPAAPIYNDAGITMISPSCTAPALTGEGTHVDSFLRTAHNDNIQGRVMAEFVYEELGLRKAATIHDGSPYAEQLQQVFANVFTEMGGEITAQEAVNVGDTDMRPVLTSIATGEPELLYYPIFIAEGGFITTQAKEIAGLENTVLAGADGMTSPDFIAAAGDASDGMYLSGPDLGFENEIYTAFLATYAELAGGDPSAPFHAHAFDASLMLFDAIEAVAQKDGDGNTVIGRQALRDALYATTGLAGITGTINCDGMGDCADPQIAVNQVQAGNFVPVFPSGDEAMAEGEAMEEAGPLEIDPIRVAVVMPSSTTDLAWSQAIYDALVRIQERAGGDSVFEIAFTEGMFNVTDAAAALRDYAADGNNIVIAHGTQYGTSMFEIAPDFPDTTFVWGTATDTGEGDGLNNVFAYEARAEEGGFVNGVLAASLSESGVIGVVGPVEAGDAKLYIDGFVAGAQAANPDATVNVSYTGSFGDTALAAEAANTHIQAGADVLTGSAQQVVGAIGVASDKGVPWMGTQSDQSPLAPDIVVATQLYVWDDVFVDIIKKHQSGELGGTAYALTLENGGLKMLYGDGLPGGAVTAAQAAEEAIAAGEIDAMDAASAAAMMSEAPAEEEAMSVDIEPVRIALVMPSSTTDLAWSQSLYDSLVQLQEAAGGEEVVEIAFTEGMFNVTDAAAAIRDYASDGYNLVIAHGAQYGTSLFELAPDFPDTSFAWGTTTNTGVDEGITNVFAYEPRGDEGGYIMGVLAAELTEAGVIGLVGPVDAGDAKLHVDGFVAGVRDTDPDIVVNVSFTGSFGDTALAAEAANTHISAGADVLTGSSQQIVGAVGIAKEKGVPWLGFQADQSSLAPEVVVGTVLYDWRPVLLEMIKSHQSGEMGGKVLQLTLANGGQVPVYADSLSTEAVAAAEAAVQGIIDGSIEIVPEPR